MGSSLSLAQLAVDEAVWFSGADLMLARHVCLLNQIVQLSTMAGF
jgi:hypothetical protein